MKPPVLVLLCAWLPASAQPVSFNRDVRPILSDKCFRCHGPDQATRKAGLRLDRTGHDIGEELIARITTSNIDERMPPADSGQKLSAKQISTMRQWVAQGANYEKHWSLIPPSRPRVPNSADPRVRNAIDGFVLSRLQREGMSFSQEAGREMLIRRLTLAITSLPPAIRELDAFLSDDQPGAYDRLIDRLLRSAHFGESMAGPWLDAARYADTNGYFTDNERTMWPWRDWVIRAFNANLPFDQFTIEQLAGDLLPEPTLQQKIATGFNRNHMVNNESGLIPEEFRVEYVADRVKTTSTVWMGLTVECARCHDHKYDPISQRDYYRFFAFFNNVPERGLDGSRGNAAPLLNVASPELETVIASFKKRFLQAEAKFKPIQKEISEAQAEWEDAALENLSPSPTNGLVAHYPLEKSVGRPASVPAMLGNGVNFKGGEVIGIDSAPALSANKPFTISVWVKPSAAGCILSRMDEADHMRGFDLVYRKNKILFHLVHKWTESDIEVRTIESVPGRRWSHVIVSYDGSSTASGVAIYLNGVRQALSIDRDGLGGSISNDEPLRIGRRKASASYKGVIDELRFYDRELSENDIRQLATEQFLGGALAKDTKKRDKYLTARLREHYVANHASEMHRQADQRITRKRKELAELQSSRPVMMVMSEMKKARQAHLLERGEYNKPRDKVSAGVPAVLANLSNTVMSNRLDLARWLMHHDNPLTSRVIVNRVWSRFFGRGIVATAEDFGTQGAWPDHPELLDWLACEFRDSGWDFKRLIRLIVTSATYRQTSHGSPDLNQRDPGNRLLARGPRIRLDAETLRDVALAAGGLLVVRQGGPSVKPYQPAGLWKEMTYDGQLGYDTGSGADLYRRSLYTYWKRQAPPPNMLLFDAPTRETCAVGRPRTNTPLQALALMNDPTFLEAARSLAERMYSQATPLRFGFRVVLSREPTSSEHDTLSQLFHSQLNAFRSDLDAARGLISIGESEPAAGLNPFRLAALTTVANMILSLDEAITQP